MGISEVERALLSGTEDRHSAPKASEKGRSIIVVEWNDATESRTAGVKTLFHSCERPIVFNEMAAECASQGLNAHSHVVRNGPGSSGASQCLVTCIGPCECQRRNRFGRKGTTTFAALTSNTAIAKAKIRIGQPAVHRIGLWLECLL